MGALWGWCLILLLSGCKVWEADFNGSFILRGVYAGQVSDYPNPGETTSLRFEATPTWEDEKTYRISGQLQLGNQPPQPMQGTGYANQYKFVQKTLSEPRPPSAILEVPALNIRLYLGYTDSRPAPSPPNGPWHRYVLVVECPATTACTPGYHPVQFDPPAPWGR
ncbi:MAG: hypothetical protein RMK51_00455 [Meiothermus sp.]|uniref:hypothetical protein n=1 Tax=Meiothermus sp. TaxID=1955249 RepID=UPI0025F076A5|nr:hypothetical protein [Meiothermus sp.]MCS7067995.1 hypothetical protein [Meiothermus sp.]MDW8424374.1 hypothetical protein [Meiothermus sp.]